MRYPEQPIRLHGLRVVLATGSALLSLLAVCATAPSAHAQEELTGVRSMGMGGANRAIVTGNDAIYLNPAGMSQGKKYSLEGNYQYDIGRETHAPGASIVDSVTSAMAAGVAYGYVSGKKTLRTNALDGSVLSNVVDRSGNIVHLGISMPLGKNTSIGVAGKYMDISYGGRSAINAIGVDAGLLYRVSPMIALAVTGYGLTNTGSAEAPRALGFGVAVGPPATFQLAVDWVVDFTSAQYNESFAPSQRVAGTKHQVFAGMELIFAKSFSLRAGYFHDRATRLEPDNAFTVGFGYFSMKNRLGIQVAFQQRFLNTEERTLVGGFILYI